MSENGCIPGHEETSAMLGPFTELLSDKIHVMMALPWEKHEYKFLHNPLEQENQFLKWKKEKSSTKKKRYI
jgi:hypothetical protein